MSLSSPTIPTAPTATTGSTSFIDPFALGNVQQSYNVGAGIANQAGSLQNINTPLYQQGWTQIGTGPGGVPIYQVNQQFTDPQNQQNYNQYLQNQGWAGSTMFPTMAQNGATLAASTAPGTLQQAGGLLGAGGPAQGALSQAMGTLGLSNQDLAQSNQFLGQVQPNVGAANQDFSKANQYLGQVPGTFQNIVNPLIGGSNQLFNTGSQWGRNAGQGQTQAEQMLSRYQGENPNQIGNMTQGLTGQRMDSAVAGIAPFQQTQRSQLDNQLRNQGLAPGNPGYDNAMRELDTSQNLAISTFESQFEPQAWQQATQIYQDPLSKAQADIAGVQSAQGVGGLYGTLGQGVGGLANTGISEAGQQIGLGGAQGALGAQQLGAASADIGAANASTGAAQAQTGVAGQQAGVGAQYGALGNAMTGLGQAQGNLGLGMSSQALPWLAASAPTMPQTPSNPGLGIQPVNISALGSSYNQLLNSNFANQLSAYNAQLAQNQNMLSGLFGVGSSVLGGLAAGGLFSDRTLKENIKPIGTLPNGIPLYTFNYKWGGPTITGPMADEVEKIMPQAVKTIDGFKLVNYQMVING